MTVGDRTPLDTWGERVEAALRDSDIALARAAADRARDIASTPRDISRATLWQARCYYMNDELEAALPLALQSAASSELLGDLGLQAESRTLVARILRLAGDSEGALTHALAAFRMLQAVDAEYADALLRPRMLAQTALGLVYLNLGNLSPALEHCQQAVECAQRLGDQNASESASTRWPAFKGRLPNSRAEWDASPNVHYGCARLSRIRPRLYELPAQKGIKLTKLQR